MELRAVLFFFFFNNEEDLSMLVGRKEGDWNEGDRKGMELMENARFWKRLQEIKDMD